MSNPWSCKKCGAPMQHEAVEQADKIVKKVVASNPKLRPKRPIHICGGCFGIHYEDAGQYRLLTAAEMFELEMQIPEWLEYMRSHHFTPAPGCLPVAGIFIRGEKP